MADNLQYRLEIPSKIFNRDFIWAETQVRETQADPANAGKWMIFASLARGLDGLTELDRLWKVIAHETFTRQFYNASASTFKKTRLNRDDYGVICVHTIDYSDKREALETGIKIVFLLNMMKTPLLRPLAFKSFEEKGSGSYPAGPNMYEMEYSEERITFRESDSLRPEEKMNLNLLQTNVIGQRQTSAEYMENLKAYQIIRN